ncbi:MAG: hypothetical protein V3S55_06225 [Nitrospiraceae bacterium]
MTDARTIAEPLTREQLEERYDAAIPESALRRLKYGSATAAEIARVEDSMHFYRRDHGRLQVSAREWLARGNPVMYARNRADARLYRREWKTLRGELNILRSDRAAFANATRVLDQIAQAAEAEWED